MLGPVIRNELVELVADAVPVTRPGVSFGACLRVQAQLIAHAWSHVL